MAISGLLKTHLATMLFTCAVVLSFSQTAQAKPYANAEGWIDLFNGSNLDGWTPKVTGHALGVNHGDTFRVEGGLLKVRYDKYDAFNNQFGHLFYETPFSHYAIHVEYRFVGEQASGAPEGWAVRNSGIMLHAQNPVSIALEQDFPRAIEVQFLGGLADGQPRSTANLCTPGTHVHIDNVLFAEHCKSSKSATFDGNQWVNVVAVVLGGGRVRHYVNGELVLTYSRPVIDTAADNKLSALEKGYLALQSESHPIDFRQVRILPLVGCTDPGASNYRPYAIKSGPCESQ